MALTVFHVVCFAAESPTKKESPANSESEQPAQQPLYANDPPKDPSPPVTPTALKEVNGTSTPDGKPPRSPSPETQKANNEKASINKSPPTTKKVEQLYDIPVGE